MRFENEGLIDQLINEVVQTPTPLPLLSFVLSEMYVRAVSRGDPDRTVRQADYDTLEGVTGALQHRATEEYERDPMLQASFQRILLRMVSLEGGEPSRRRIARAELDFINQDENARIAEVLKRLIDARLVVSDFVAGVPLIEPAHEALIRGWDRIGAWIRQTRGDLPLVQTFGSDAAAWVRDGRPPGQLWDEDVRLQQVLGIAGANGKLELNRVETEFLEASLSRRRRDRIRRRVAIGIAIGLSVAAILVVAFLWLQGSHRATTAALLARTSEITSRLDGPRQLDGLFSAIDAASIADGTFGHMPAAVRGSFLRALERARETDRWEAAPIRITEITVTPDGHEILGVYLPETNTNVANSIVIRSWSLARPHQVRDIRVAGPLKTTDDRYPVALCSSGACFAVERPGGTEVFDPRGRSLWRIPVPTGPAAVDTGIVMSMAYSPWSDLLVSGGTVGTTNLLPLSLWGRSGDQQQSVTAHLPMVTSVAFDPSERLILSGGTDGAVRMWDENLLQVGPDIAHLGELVAGVAAGRSQPVIAAIGGTGSVVILDLDDAALLHYACGRIFQHTRLINPKTELDKRVSEICTNSLTVGRM